MTALALAGYSYAPSFAWLVALGIPLGLGAVMPVVVALLISLLFVTTWLDRLT